MILHIIYGHVWEEDIWYCMNSTSLSLRIKHKTLVFLAVSCYEVDVFFFIGGFFSAFVLVEKWPKRKNSTLCCGENCCCCSSICCKGTNSFFCFPYFKIMILRWARIMPAYMGAIFFYMSILPMMLNGPISYDFEEKIT